MITLTGQRLLTLTGAGLRADVWPHGGLRWLAADQSGSDQAGEELLVNLHPASGLEPGPANLWLRRRRRGTPGWEAHPLLGPTSGSAVGQTEASLLITGRWEDLHYAAELSLSQHSPTWRWSVTVDRAAADDHEPVDVDLVWTQDVGLAARGVVRSNELYVSQYLDLTPLTDDRRGTVLAVRQNQAQHGRHPWLLLGSDDQGTGYATDARQIFGLTQRNGEPPAGLVTDLPSQRLQHEHTVVGLQSETVALAPGAGWRTGFFGHLVHDHPAPTSTADLAVLAEVDGALPPEPTRTLQDAYARDERTVFSPAQLWRSDDLAEADVVADWGELRLAERDASGRLLSFFTDDDRHVVLRAKEQTVLRPHGRLLRGGHGLLPDPDGIALTTWMTGSPLSYLTRGHASTGRVLSTVRGYLGWHRAYGLRVLVRQDDRWLLLDQPSACEMGPEHCRWLYRSGEHEIMITTTVPTGSRRAEVVIEVTAGPPCSFLLALGSADGDDGLDPGRVDHDVLEHPSGTKITVHPSGTAFDVDGPATVGDDGPLFLDGRSRGLTWLTITTLVRARVTLAVGPAEQSLEELWPDLQSAATFHGGDREEIDPVAAALPWMVSDALTHYLSPRGLEQYTGGAWGTRDVCQGPVELLLALGRHEELRRVLIMIMAAQSADGDWPQAFGFLPGDGFRWGPAHGDVIFWPILAVGRYLLATGDESLLREQIPSADGSNGTVHDQLLRAVELAARRVLPGTHLTAYGHGDWNDSLQPADPRLAQEMTSAWTVTLHHQALTTLADGLTVVGDHPTADRLRADARVIAEEFAEHLAPDQLVAGYAVLDADGRPTRHLLHPRDTETGLRYSVLPMIHAVITGLFTPEQARQHLMIIDEHLRGADGIRLFDAPPAYRGGETVHFQRAETATFVGREIGLMYTHAHLRYLEALAMVGDAEDLWWSLRQVINIDVAAAVPNARPRQANCYTSSSDAAVADRAAFAQQYQEIVAGAVEVEAGWRVYSSGPGILVRLVRECLLGLRVRASGLEIDPVLTTRCDGVRTSVRVAGRTLRVQFRVAADGGEVTDVTADGVPLTTRRLANPYRLGGLLVDRETLAGLPDGTELEVVTA